ncbi:MAG: hypothetical protein AAGF83_22900 [Cyanobacteria bacterium P01_G01_bin.67]
MKTVIMHSQVEEVKQIAAQLLAGMLANPYLNHAFPTESGKLDGDQQSELIEAAITMSEELIARSEARIESYFQHNFSSGEVTTKHSFTKSK